MPEPRRKSYQFMQTLIPALGVGFLLGLRHATDPDHLVAMSTLVSRSKRFGASWLLGVLWGLGHSLTIFAVGVLIIGLKIGVPSRVGASLEFSVGVMLFALGVANIAGFGLGRLGIREHVHEHGHDHEHGETHHHHPGAEPRGPHSHLHAHSPAVESLAAGAGRTQLWRSFGVGLVHGLAGSSAVALMVLAAIPGLGSQLAYLALFGVGTLAGMMGLSTAMEGALFLALRRMDVQRWVAAASGYVSLGFGLYIMYIIGFVGWTPH